MGGAWPRVKRSRDGSLLADIRAQLGQIRESLSVSCHKSVGEVVRGCSSLFTGRSPVEIRSRESGLVGAAASELGVVGASGSGGAWGSGQTALIRSGDADE